VSIIEAIILGIVQGLTEFLPVSSSGHIELGKALLGVEVSDNVAFTIIVHGATVLSILLVFYKDIIQLFKALFSFSWNTDTQYIAKLLLSMLPVGVIGILFEDQVEALFTGNILLVGVCLLATAAILLLTTLERPQKRAVNFVDAIIIGLSQAIAILPGISRSGTTISTALALGIDKERATRFSFLMVLLPISGATLLKFKDISESTGDTTMWVYIAGFIAAFVSGTIACNWMLAIVKRGKIAYFSVYCLVVGLVAIALGLWG
jgi:undecaprenyl-diphosphatase